MLTSHDHSCSYNCVPLTLEPIHVICDPPPPPPPPVQSDPPDLGPPHTIRSHPHSPHNTYLSSGYSQTPQPSCSLSQDLYSIALVITYTPKSPIYGYLPTPPSQFITPLISPPHPSRLTSPPLSSQLPTLSSHLPTPLTSPPHPSHLTSHPSHLTTLSSHLPTPLISPPHPSHLPSTPLISPPHPSHLPSTPLISSPHPSHLTSRPLSSHLPTPLTSSHLSSDLTSPPLSSHLPTPLTSPPTLSPHLPTLSTHLPTPLISPPHPSHLPTPLTSPPHPSHLTSPPLLSHLSTPLISPPHPYSTSPLSSPLMRKKKAPVSLATALAMRVFPVPGGPYKSIPLGGLTPMALNSCGCLNGSSTICKGVIPIIV